MVRGVFEVFVFDDIVKLERNGAFEATYVSSKTYNDNHVFDEDKSVKWNKEEVYRRNEGKKVAIKEYREKKNFLYNEMKELFIGLAMEDYKLTHEQARLIYEKAWQEGHSEGVESVSWHFEELLELFSKVMNSK